MPGGWRSGCGTFPDPLVHDPGLGELPLSPLVPAQAEPSFAGRRSFARFWVPSCAATSGWGNELVSNGDGALSPGYPSSKSPPPPPPSCPSLAARTATEARCGPRHRLRLRGPRLRRHAAGRPRGHAFPPTRSPNPERPTSLPMSISPHSPALPPRPGAAARPLIAQGEFLGRLGIAARAARLAAGKDATRRGTPSPRRPPGSPRPTRWAISSRSCALSHSGLALPAFDGDA